jgi:hypothetical protein
MEDEELDFMIGLMDKFIPSIIKGISTLHRNNYKQVNHGKYQQLKMIRK